MTGKKQDTDRDQDRLLEDRLFSRDEAWEKAREIIDELRADEGQRFGQVGGYLKNNCVEVFAVARMVGVEAKLIEDYMERKYFAYVKLNSDTERPCVIFDVPYLR